MINWANTDTGWDLAYPLCYITLTQRSHQSWKWHPMAAPEVIVKKRTLEFVIKKGHIFRGVKADSIFPPQDRQSIKQNLKPGQGEYRSALETHSVWLNSTACPVSLDRLLSKNELTLQTGAPNYYSCFLYYQYSTRWIYVYTHKVRQK